MRGSSSLAVPAGPGEDLAAALAADWRRGTCQPAETYLDPATAPEAAVRLIYEEVCLRQERGEEIARAELLGRFPHWADALTVMLDCHRLVHDYLAPLHFPVVGATLGDFRLSAELGRGRQSRAYLAVQPTLADRQVVLKVAPRRDQEFLSLARLQHSHIIPLYAIHDFPEFGLHALCQPYLGGATLERVLHFFRPIPPALRTGRMLVEILDRAAPSRLPAQPTGARAALAQRSYVEAICWIGACLADGLHYAHERGLVHLDLKPSNILLAGDGQPLLLDFHLALHPLVAGQTAPDEFGGTPHYMSPEQARAYAAAQERQPIPEAIDGRSDLYALARVLDEALAGQPQVSRGLADLLRKGLAADPAERYPDAAAFAADLRRHLFHQPLHGVPNRSLTERWTKWRRRRPYAPLWLVLLLTLSAVGVFLTAETATRFEDAYQARHDGQAQLERQAYPEALGTLARGRARVANVPGSAALVATLDRQLAQARRGQAAHDLHVLADRLRFLADADTLTTLELRTLEAHCHAAWAARDRVAGAADGPLDADTEARVQCDLLDLVLVRSDVLHLLRERGAPGYARADAQALLMEAETLLGSLPALERERQRWHGVSLAALPILTREPRRQGEALLRAGAVEQAAHAFDRATELHPADVWAHFERGRCAVRQGDFAQAVQSFGVVIALAPENAEGYYHRALAFAAWKKPSPALRDYDRALTLAPHLAAAALNRGVLHYEEGRLAAARADLQQALHDGADPASAYYNLALVAQAQHDDALARLYTAQALHHDPAHAPTRALQQRLTRR